MPFTPAVIVRLLFLLLAVILVYLLLDSRVFGEGPAVDNCRITLETGNEADLAGLKWYDQPTNDPGETRRTPVGETRPASTNVDCRQAGYQNGQHYLRARTFDTSGNLSDESGPPVPFVLTAQNICIGPRIVTFGDVPFPTDGLLILNWEQVACGVKYRVNVHQWGQPYEAGPENYAFQGTVVGASVPVTVKAGTKYDAWIFAIGADGTEYTAGTQGTSFTVGALIPPPPPPPPPDTDGDGVPDSTDQCPTTPGPATNHGCPVLVPPPPPVSLFMALSRAAERCLKVSSCSGKTLAGYQTEEVAKVTDPAPPAYSLLQALTAAADHCLRVTSCSGKLLAGYQLDEFKKVPIPFPSPTP